MQAYDHQPRVSMLPASDPAPARPAKIAPGAPIGQVSE
jgi:hypothetical protein